MQSRHHLAQSCATLLFISIALPTMAGERDWPGWRGPRGDGVSQSTGVPVDWSDEENIAWRVRVPGVGHSSPILVGDRVLVTTCIVEREQRAVVCFDRQTGAQRWITSVAVAEIEEMHNQNTPASATPASDGHLVYATFMVDGEYLIAALDLEGVVQWDRRLGPFVSHHGFCSVPVLHDDAVLIAAMHDSDQSFVAKLDKSTGATMWKQPTGTAIRSFSPPLPVADGASGSVVVSGADCTSGYDQATGELLWRSPGPAQKTVSSLVLWRDSLLVCGGRDNKLFAIDGVMEREPRIAWTCGKGVPYVSSPILAAGQLHMASDNGVVTSIEPETGQIVRQRRLLGPTSASPILAEGRLYFVDERGKTLVIAMEPEFRVIAENQLGEPVFASPAPSDGELFLRGTEHLYCIREAPAGPAARVTRVAGDAL